MIVTAFYAALLTPLFVLLSVRVIGARRAGKQALGDGGDAALLRRMRVQANFAEYVPLALILLSLAESMRAPVWLLHGLGITLLAGRVSHAWGVSRPDETLSFRVAGMAMTLLTLGMSAVLCLVLSVSASVFR